MHLHDRGKFASEYTFVTMIIFYLKVKLIQIPSATGMKSNNSARFQTAINQIDSKIMGKVLRSPEIYFADITLHHLRWLGVSM